MIGRWLLLAGIVLALPGCVEPAARHYCWLNVEVASGPAEATMDPADVRDRAPALAEALEQAGREGKASIREDHDGYRSAFDYLVGKNLDHKPFDYAGRAYNGHGICA